MLQQLLEYFNPLNVMPLWLIIAFLISFFVSYNSLPTIIHIARVKHLVDEPDERSTHSNTTPTLGGVGIYLGMAVVITTIGALLDTKIMLLVLGGMTLLFFLGLKDDLLVLSPKKKFIGQLVTALLLIVFTDTHLTSLSGFFGLTLIPYWASVALTLFVYILIINAYNLIDGVDGLAGSIGLFCASVFVFIFIQTKDITLATIAVGLVGALLPFLRFNFSNRKKIFMGDTGSMVIGFLIAFFIVRFISQSHVHKNPLFFDRAPILALAIVFFPLLDTLRIFIIRIFIHKTSPFKADKNHIHHRFLELGFSHKQTTICVVLINALIVVFAFLIGDLNIHFQFVSIFLLGNSLYAALFIYYAIKKNKFETHKK